MNGMRRRTAARRAEALASSSFARTTCVVALASAFTATAKQSAVTARVGYERVARPPHREGSREAVSHRSEGPNSQGQAHSKDSRARQQTDREEEGRLSLSVSVVRMREVETRVARVAPDTRRNGRRQDGRAG